MKNLAIFALLLGSALAAVDPLKSHIDEARSSFSPTTTNSHSLSRSASPLVYAQNRDSYVNAASQAGYSGGAVGGSSAGTSGAASSSYGAPATGGGQAGGYGQGPGQQSYQDDDDGGFGGAGLGGLAGLLGLKGLKGLGGLGLLALLKLFKPLLLPLLLPFLLLLPLLLLFIPIPVITIPAAGRRAFEADGLGSLVTDKAYKTAQIAQDVLTSGLCVERLACELSTRTHGTFLDKMITQVFEKTESLSSKKWRRAMRAYIDSGFNSEIPAESRSACAKYACDLYKEFSSRVSPAANEVPGSSSQEN